MLRDAGDVQVGGYATTTGVDAEVAVALTDRLDVSGAFSFSDTEQSRCLRDVSLDCSEEAEDYRRHRFGEVSAGYRFLVFPSSVASYQGGFGEVRAGYGRGWAEALDTYEFFGSNRILARGQYRRVFVQPGAYVDRGVLQVHHAWRFSHVRFSSFEGPDETYGRTDVNVFLEPAVTLRIGPDPLVFVAQTSLALPLTEPAYDFTPLTISLGAHVRLNELF